MGLGASQLPVCDACGVDVFLGSSAGYQMSWGAAEEVGSLVNSGLNLSNK